MPRNCVTTRRESCEAPSVVRSWKSLTAPVASMLTATSACEVVAARQISALTLRILARFQCLKAALQLVGGALGALDLARARSDGSGTA